MKWFPKLSFRRPAQRTSLRAYFQSAGRDRLTKSHFAEARGQNVNFAISTEGVLIGDRAEREYHSNPILRGIVETHRTDLIGIDGPTLQVTSSSEAYNDKVLEIWRSWWAAPDVQRRMSGAALLRMFVTMGWLRGEMIYQRVTDRQAETPIKLRIKAIHPRRMLTPPTMAGRMDVGLGMQLDANGAPLRYFIAKEIALGDSSYLSSEFDTIDASNIDHIFEVEQPDQFRGIPWATPCLYVAAELRDFDASVLAASRAAAKWGAVLLECMNTNGDPIEIDGEYEIESATIRALPPGYTAKQLAPGQPAANYVEYRKERMTDMGAPVNMPAMMVRKDSGDHNFSSARFDSQIYLRSLEFKRAMIEDMVIGRWLRSVIREAELAGLLPAAPPDVNFSWTWPALASVKPLEDAQTEEQEMINGTLTFSEACRRRNLDPKTVISEQQKDAKNREGLPPLPSFQQKSTPAPEDPAAAPAGSKKPASSAARVLQIGADQ